MDERSALLAMRNRDPDGSSIRPTAGHYAAFEAWAISTFGRATFERYRRGGWGDQPEV